MKRILFVFMFLTIVCCCYAKRCVRALSQRIEYRDSIAWGKGELFFETDSAAVTTKLYYGSLDSEDGGWIFIDSIEFTPYIRYIHTFKHKNDDKIFFLENQYEYFSETIGYSISGNKIVRLGNVNVFKHDSESEFYEFPLNEICVKENNRFVILSFSGDDYFTIDSQGNVIEVCKICYFYDKKTSALTVKYKL